ncbi:MAG: flap endonuclease-1 [Candidatus Bathyarchaeia archaeon]|nr:flap endonuclease-1 [Candidatus Bathyarchaeota archaeon]
MGVNLGDLISKKKITFDDLKGKVVAIDAYNALYQFLTIIRGVSGEPLMDTHGRITSHLSGLLYRTSNLVEKGIKPVYVFDGKPPALKEVELKRRLTIKEEAVVKYEEAVKRGDLEEARKYAQMSAKLKDEMVEDAKQLLTLLGIPWVQAPSEGEAQAAFIAAKGDAWCASSQDYDSLLFGAPRLVRNLTISGKRKLPKKNVYIEVELELIELDKILKELELTREQLIDLAILIGTDYNPEGVKGIGPKTALKLIKQYKKLEVIKIEGLPENFLEIRKIFLKPKVEENYSLKWSKPNVDGVIQFLCNERDFSESRVKTALEKMLSGLSQEKRTLESFFG